MGETYKPPDAEFAEEQRRRSRLLRSESARLAHAFIASSSAHESALASAHRIAGEAQGQRLISAFVRAAGLANGLEAFYPDRTDRHRIRPMVKVDGFLEHPCGLTVKVAVFVDASANTGHWRGLVVFSQGQRFRMGQGEVSDSNGSNIRGLAFAAFRRLFYSVHLD